MLLASCRDGRWRSRRFCRTGICRCRLRPASCTTGRRSSRASRRIARSMGGSAVFRPVGEFRALESLGGAPGDAARAAGTCSWTDCSSCCGSIDEWVPRGEGGALYIRPVYVASEAFLQVRPSRQLSVHGDHQPFGTVLHRRRRPAGRAAVRARVPGRHRRRQSRGQLRRESLGRAASAEAGVSYRALARFGGASLRRRVRADEHRLCDGRPGGDAAALRHDPPWHHARFGVDAMPRHGRHGGGAAHSDRRAVRASSDGEAHAGGRRRHRRDGGADPEDPISSTAKSSWRRTTRTRRSIARAQGNSKPSAPARCRTRAAGSHSFEDASCRTSP